jgi:hypothetical protein
MKNIMLLAVLSTLIQGCTSISQPTASRPLVEHEFKSLASAAAVDVSLSTALSNTKSGATFIIQEKSMVMGNTFFAATGLTCRKLISEQVGQHIYCLNNQGNWFQVKKVISEYNESDMTEATL